jgi:hypothetical protein
MRYDMQALKKIGDLEDSLREKLGEVYGCDPDDLPIDFDLSDIYGASSDSRVELLVWFLLCLCLCLSLTSLSREQTAALQEAPGDLTALIHETCEQLDLISEESKAAEKKKTPTSP